MNNSLVVACRTTALTVQSRDSVYRLALLAGLVCTHLNVLLTARRRWIHGHLGSARRQEISDLLLEIPDPVRQPEIVGAQSAQRREGLALP